MILKVPSFLKKMCKQEIDTLLEIQNFTPFFKNKPISKEDVGYILNSVKFGIKRESQEPLSFVFIENQDIKELLKNKYQQNLFVTAPVVICVLGSFAPKTEKLTLEKKQQYLWFQVGSAITNMCLTAANINLGFWFEEYTSEFDNIKKLIGADVNNYYLVGFCFIGEPELKNLKPRTLKDPSIFFDRFNNKERKNKGTYFTT